MPTTRRTQRPVIDIFNRPDQTHQGNNITDSEAFRVSANSAANETDSDFALFGADEVENERENYGENKEIHSDDDDSKVNDGKVESKEGGIAAPTQPAQIEGIFEVEQEWEDRYNDSDSSSSSFESDKPHFRVTRESARQAAAVAAEKAKQQQPPLEHKVTDMTSFLRVFLNSDGAAVGLPFRRAVDAVIVISKHRKLCIFSFLFMVRIVGCITGQQQMVVLHG
ncbi:unknown protein [Seminavis robusta]|uniref:Uncharacterized protein n=1 Tax=Seminavis robusta TaxID=568900 RepID=A0A9N8H9F6_9STRA|nr:unknown protein [Seminavis robusta]|eukprot:Sro253_g099740.1 n/a (224) ;mRNA; r:6935-7606